MAYLSRETYKTAITPWRDPKQLSFLAYFPCAKKVGNKRYDCIAFSRTFDVLDFRNVKIISLYKNFLREYLKLWRENYIELVFKSEPR